MAHTGETHTTELLVSGEIDTLCLLEAHDSKIGVPFCDGPYIPYGIEEADTRLSFGYLNVERAEQIGERAVRLFLLSNSGEDPFGVVTYNNWTERQFTKTPKTQDLIVESDDEARKWRAILNTDSALSDSDKAAFSNVLGKLSWHVRSRKRQGKL